MSEARFTIFGLILSSHFVFTNAEANNKSVFEAGATALSEYPLQVTALLIAVIFLAVCAELMVDNLKHSINDAFRRILDAVVNEVMILGIVSIVLFLLEDTKAWDDVTIDDKHVDLHVVHFIHMALFLVALFYIFSNISMILLMSLTAKRWASYEAFCIEDEKSTFYDIRPDMRGSFDSVDMNTLTHRGSETDMSSKLRDILIDMDTKLKVYTDWRASASFLDVLFNLKKVIDGRELKRAVQFRHIRSFFLSQGRRRNSIADIESILHNQFRFSNFLYRCAIQDLNKCCSIGIKVWLFLGVLIGMDALRIQIQDSISHKKHPDPLHDIFFWIAVQYVVLAFLFVMNRVVKKAWSVFKKQNETAVRISQKLRKSVTDKTIREVVRKKMLEKEIRIIKAEEFQKLFLFNSPEMTFTFIKIGVMVCCWTLMLYILGYSRKLWSPEFLHPGKAALLTLAYVAPPCIIFWFIIPETIGIMSVLMSARDLSLATPGEKKTLVELMRISMSEELTLFKVKPKRKLSHNRPSDDGGADSEKESFSDAQFLTQESLKPFASNQDLHIDTQLETKDADVSNRSTPYSPTVAFSETPKGHPNTMDYKPYLVSLTQSPSPRMSARKTTAPGERPQSAPPRGLSPLVLGRKDQSTPALGQPAPTVPPPAKRRNSYMHPSVLDQARAFIRDHIVLSDGEAVVHRIRQNCENDVDENNEEVMEWEKNRRKEAFARYGDTVSHASADIELSILPKLRSRSMSRDKLTGPGLRTDSMSTNLSDRRNQLRAGSNSAMYSSVAEEGSNSDSQVESDIETSRGQSQMRQNSLFREVSDHIFSDALDNGSREDIDVSEAERIIRENNLDDFLSDPSRIQI